MIPFMGNEVKTNILNIRGKDEVIKNNLDFKYTLYGGYT